MRVYDFKLFYLAAPASASLCLLPPRCACSRLAAPARISLRLLPPRYASCRSVAPAQLAAHAPNHAAPAPKLNLAAHAVSLAQNLKICCF